ncbi:MAG: hypothetical protein WCA12_09455 [Burkholderiales bacterium]
MSCGFPWSVRPWAITAAGYVVTLPPGDVIEFRELWRRKAFSAPLGSVFDQVVRWHVTEALARKRAERKWRRWR